MNLLIMMKEYSQRAKNISYFKTNLAKIDTLFLTKTTEKAYPLGTHTYTL